MLLSDWCGSDLKIEFEDIRGAYEVTFTAPPANGSTVTISPLTRLVIDKDGYLPWHKIGMAAGRIIPAMVGSLKTTA